ncbi:MAG: acetyl-CoA carboxylase biotin carboxyl carrier protein subunit [Geobacteraceae bacterium]|nr:acetyl-CoA carboxylase biotin carboxyl carrier protein subunit [Geobacteraceae bacterium]
MAELTSPIAGKVWKIMVAVGDKVEMDDELIILEALKMETPVYSEESGTVSAIMIKEGDPINEGDILISIG